MDTEELKSFTRQVLQNCDISDAYHAGLYSICGLALRLRDLYKWENQLPPWEERDSSEILDGIESNATSADAERLDALMADPASRPATIAWYTAEQEKLDAGIASSVDGDDAERLDVLIANPASRPAAIASYKAQQEAEVVSNDPSNELERENKLMADPAARLGLIDWYASRAKDNW